MGATRDVAESIADYIQNRAYDDMPTKKILRMIFGQLRKHKPVVKHQIDLRKALSLLNPAPDFERYIQLLLAEYGYEVTPNQIIRGRCIEHEIDAVARKNGKTYIVEVKHHHQYHTPTSLDVSRILRAVFEDITEGYQQGMNNLKIDYALIVCNTKLSEHARRYADCRGIKHIGWSSPKNHDLQTMIGKKKLYPITFLKVLDTETRSKLVANGIVMLKQLFEERSEKLGRRIGISRVRLDRMLKIAGDVLSGA